LPWSYIERAAFVAYPPTGPACLECLKVYAFIFF